MNSVTMQNVTVSKNFYGEAVTVTNGVVSFNGYEKDVSNDTVKYRNYSFRAFDQVAEKILKMKMRVGSVINITGQMDQFVNKSDNRVKNFIRIDRIEYSPYLLPPQKHDEESETEEDNGTKPIVTPLDLENSEMFNLNVDENEEIFQ